MKEIIRNILILFFYLTSIPFWRRIFLNKPLVRVWCLHQVKDFQAEGFKQKLAYVRKHFNVITPEQFFKKEFNSKKINLLITFDDGFESWFVNVLPFLRENDFKAIFFINHSFRCHESKLLAEGHSLGGHSAGHSRLARVSREILHQEIQNSVKSDFFAYPFGDKKSFNQIVAGELKNAGYKYAFTILPGYNNVKTNQYFLHRDSLDADVPNWLFNIWLKGSYDILKPGKIYRSNTQKNY